MNDSTETSAAADGRPDVPELQPWLLALVLAMSGAVLLPVAALRLIDGDEGYYLYAARLALAGDLPYREFFYPQMPLLPYVYGVWMRLFGESWEAARLLSALLGMAVAAMLYRHVERTTRRRGAGLSAAAAFALAGLTFAWFTVAKTYALSAFLLFLSLYSLSHGWGLSPWLRGFVAGVAAALAVDARLMMIAAVPGLLYAVWATRNLHGQRHTAALWFCGGLIAGFLPAAAFWAAAPEGFWFGNVGYHGLRSQGGLIGNWGQKAEVVLSLLGLKNARGGESVQFLMLVLAALAGVIHCLRLKRPLPAAMVVALFLAAGSLLPTPTYFQYYCVVVPFLIAGAAEALWRGRETSDQLTSDELQPERNGEAPPSGWRTRIVPGFLTVAGLIYVAVVPYDLYRYLESGVEVPGPPEPRFAVDWKLSTVRSVGREIDARTQPGEAVITWWPGYLIGTHARTIPHMENHFGQEMAHRLPSDQRRQRRLLSYDDISNQIAGGSVRVVVLGNWTGGWMSHLRERYREELIRAGYRPVAEAGHTEIFARPRWP